MRAPAWACLLLSRLAPPERKEEVVGDLEEAHAWRVHRHGRLLAAILTSLESLDMALALLRLRRRAGRRGRGPAWRGHRTRFSGIRIPGVSRIDVTLGARVLMKNPALSIVSGLGMAVAVAIGTGAFGVIRGMTSSPLPLDEGHGIVTIQNIATFGLEQARSTHLHSLQSWREQSAVFQEVGAYRILARNLLTADGSVTPAKVTEMTASGFRIPRVPPEMGRYLVEEDEARDAPAVAVIGHGLWKERFGSDPAVVGHSISIGGVSHTIVGVMPEGFAFPINDRLWVPLRLDPAGFSVGQAPPIQVFARLAPGVTPEEASARLTMRDGDPSSERLGTIREVRPGVFPYTRAFVWGPMGWVLYLVQTALSLLAVVIAVNVAALVYARTAGRIGEMAVRTALGASRGRIVSQLFLEAFLLASAASFLGMGAAGILLPRVGDHLRRTMGQELPFWWTFGLSTREVAYGFGLAVLLAVITGVIPALGATGRHLHLHLKSGGPGGSGPRLGTTWTVLIVAQIAIAVAVLPIAFSGAAKWMRAAEAPGNSFPLSEVLVARLELDQERPPMAEREAAPVQGESVLEPWTEYRTLRDELVRRLEGIQGVTGVALMSVSPWEDPDLPFELDGAQGPRSSQSTLVMESAGSGHRVGRSRVSPEFFRVAGVPVVQGRELGTADATAAPSVALVNHTFVELIMGGADPVGHTLRFPHDAPPEGGRETASWLTIVGVVPDYPPPTFANAEAKAFLPMTREISGPVSLAIRIRGGGTPRMAEALRRTAANLDPRLRLSGLESVATLHARGRDGARLLVLTVAVLSLSVLLLAVTGLYFLMAFTVAQRHREIGIRVALGAQPYRIMLGVMLRTAWQLVLGIGAGLVLVGGVDRMAGGEFLGGWEAILFPLVAGLMALVGVAAAWGPVRRGLRVEPTEALKVE